MEDGPLGTLSRRELIDSGLNPDSLTADSEHLITDSVADVIRETVYLKAYESCVRMLAVSEYAPGEIRYKLRFRGYADTIIERVVEELYANNYINDERYAESFVRSYARRKGRRNLLIELEQKGISLRDPEALIERVYAEEGITEDAVRDALLEKKFRGADPEDPTVKRRMREFLYRKGFVNGT